MEENNNDLLFGVEEETTTEQMNAEVEESTDEQTTETAEGEESAEENAETTEQASKESADAEDKEEEDDAEWEKLNPYGKAILAEMQRRVEQGDELLAKGLQSSEKSIKECCKYMEFRAKKHAEEQKIRDGVCVWMSDADGYALAHHYYTESKETIDKEMAVAKKSNLKPAEPKKKIYKNPLLEALMKKGYKADDNAVTKTTTKKDKEGNVLSSTNVKVQDDGVRVTTVEKGGKTYTMTEFSLF